VLTSQLQDTEILWPLTGVVSYKAFESGDIDVHWFTADVFSTVATDFAAYNPKIFLQADWSRGGDACVVIRGINSVNDLRGRKIALPEFTTQHYLLDTYLQTNGLKVQDVQRVYLHHNEVLKAFRRGEVDGLVHREPEIRQLLAEFGGKAKILPSRSLCVSAYLLAGKRDFVQKNPAVIKRVLRALLRAEDYAKKEPAKARNIAARTYGADQEEIKKIWGLHNYRVSLDQSLFLLLENMARWEIGLQPPAQRAPMPNYLEFLYLDGLKAIRPEAVTIIH